MGAGGLKLQVLDGPEDGNDGVAVQPILQEAEKAVDELIDLVWRQSAIVQGQPGNQIGSRHLVPSSR